MNIKMLLIIIFSAFLIKSNAQEKKRKNKNKNPFFIEEFYVLNSNALVKHGQYKKISYYDYLIAEGYFKNDMKDSLWVYYGYRNAISSFGHYSLDKKVGEWTYNNFKEEVLFKMNFDNDSMLYYNWSIATEKEINIFVNDNWLLKKITSPAIAFDNENNVVTTIADYPQLAIDQDIQGEVIIEIIVDENGKALEYSVFKSAHDMLDKPVLNAVKNIPKWKPAIFENKNVKSKVYLTYKFLLG